MIWESKWSAADRLSLVMQIASMFVFLFCFPVVSKLLHKPTPSGQKIEGNLRKWKQKGHNQKLYHWMDITEDDGNYQA